jgi:hypothetical protein
MAEMRAKMKTHAAGAGGALSAGGIGGGSAFGSSGTGATIGSLGEKTGERVQAFADKLQAELEAMPDDPSFKEIQEFNALNERFKAYSEALQNNIKNAGQVAEKAGSKQ